jgi:hypothetical protein
METENIVRLLTIGSLVVRLSGRRDDEYWFAHLLAEKRPEWKAIQQPAERYDDPH